jgi:hypothetical protein
MQIQAKVITSTVNSRVLRSGDDKGQTKYSVDVHAQVGDLVPCKFVISGLGSEAEAAALAAKHPAGSLATVRYEPRDAMWLNAQDISPATK